MKVLHVLGNENIHKVRGMISLYMVMCEDDSLRDKFISKGKYASILDVLNFNLFFFFFLN